MPARGWSRAAVALGVLALVVVGGRQAHRAVPTPRATPQPVAELPPPSAFTGPPLAGPTGLRLLVSGHRLAERDLDTGQVRDIAGVPSTPNGYRLTRTDGGAVIAQADGICVGCPGPAYVIAAGSRAGVRVAGWDGVVPAAEPDLLWGYRVADGTRAGVVRLLDLAGRPHGPAYPLPPGQGTPRRGVVSGLLTLRGGRDEVWDPRTARVVGGFGRVIAAAADRLAWVDPACDADCPVRVADLRGGGNTLYPVPGQPSAGAFSPDGRTLALAVTAAGADEPAVRAYLARDGALRPVANPVRGLSLGWSGRWLVLTTFVRRINDSAPPVSVAVAGPDDAHAHRALTAGLRAYHLVVR
jgi:hypothetical protein